MESKGKRTTRRQFIGAFGEFVLILNNIRGSKLSIDDANIPSLLSSKYLGFRVDDSETFIEVAEDFPGYKQFLKTVESRFPLKDGWWNDVAVPAFATNMMQIWARA